MINRYIKPSLVQTAVACITVSTAGLAFGFNPLQQPAGTITPPGNLILPLSVEWPTGHQVSYTATTYTAATTYYGYFDNTKCYTYSTTNEVFSPVSAMTTGAVCPATNQWSGNLLNWLTATNLDQFRSVMTGGTRDVVSSMSTTDPGDTISRTVLIRSFSEQNSLNPVKNVTISASSGSGTPGLPLNVAGISAGAASVRSGAYGSKFIIAKSGVTFANWSASQQRDTCALTPLPGTAGSSACFNIRVETCIAVAGLPIDANCVNTYKNPSTGVATAPKPEGLIQQYARTLRFGALGYLNDSNQARNGGVLRAALKSVGKDTITATGISTGNANKEWDEVTGIMIVNPDPADATASSVSNSGVMNYFNKFGYANGYKGYDPVGELYYAAQLYLRGVAPPSDYTSGITAAMLDGFPAITGSNLLAGGSRDPIIQACQKNFILGIGDIYTWCDSNLPGGTWGNMCTSGTPTDPAGINVTSLWNTVNSMEGGGGFVGGAGGTGTPYMAGLAYWANTNDIRPDLAGEQNAVTYWVDTLENTNGQSSTAAASLVKSQFWLAAKYGGFIRKGTTSNNPNTNRASWDLNNEGIPDTWFPGNSPTAMRTGLSAAFANIVSRASASSSGSPAITAQRATSTTQAMFTSYDPDGWTGRVTACSPLQSSGSCETTPTWDAAAWLNPTDAKPAYVTPSVLTPTTRKIFTSTASSTFADMPFQWGNLNSSQQAILNASDNKGADRLAYIRGDQTYEATNVFRKRPHSLLGDIVNSGTTYVGGLSRALPGTTYAGHGAYRSTTATRPGVVYTGANDGMLHAFSSATGQELFAYIPGSVFANLPALTSPAFTHQYFVDSTPMTHDIKYDSGSWGTILAGGLGGGGKGFYALDITTQKDNFANATESTLSTLPLWELTTAQEPTDLGYTFNEPAVDPITSLNMQITKIASNVAGTGNWGMVVGNGFGSASGKSVLYILNPSTGTSLIKLTAHNGPDNGLATPIPVDTDFDGIADTIYAGDLLGNIHKFQFSKSSGTNYILAKQGDTTAAWRYIGILYASGEPITMAPAVVQSCDGTGQTVMIGTGKLNEAGDYSDTSSRSFFSLTDNKPSSALTIASTNIATISYTDSASGTDTIRSWADPVMTNKVGWKMVFTGGERVLSNPGLPADTGSVLIGTTRPNGDSCTPGNSGYIAAVKICSGKTGGLIVNGALVGGLSLATTGIVKVGNSYINPNGDTVIVTNQARTKGESLSVVKATTPKGRYSWREIFNK